MITTHTFLDRCATIIKGSNANTSLSPVIELCYGQLVSRALLHFDISKIASRIADKTYPDRYKLRHTLKLFNTAAINPYQINWKYPDPALYGDRDRASSFDLIFFKINQDWDDGRGFDFAPNIGCDDSAFQTDGATWYNCRTGYRWEDEGTYAADPSVIATYRFQYGNEQPSVDITSFVNTLLDNPTENYGLGVAFSPEIEDMVRKRTQYVAFFTNHTNQIFAPYVESVYDETIEDDRANFYNGKDNKLYFYASVGGQSVNLDDEPACAINGTQLQVNQATKGIYYATVPKSMTFEDDTMYYDTWRYKYNGVEKTTELYFTPKPSSRYFSFGLPFETEKHPKFKPFLYGIKHNEVIYQGDVRKVNVECKIEYTSNQMFAVDNLEYRVYFVSGDREFEVYPWSKVERAYNTNFFLIDTAELLPTDYHIDVRATFDQEEIITKDGLRFSIAKDITEQKA